MKTLQIAKQFQSDGPQCENVKTSSISSSTVYKIIKRFRTSGEIWRKFVFCIKNHFMGSERLPEIIVCEHCVIHRG